MMKTSSMSCIFRQNNAQEISGFCRKTCVSAIKLLFHLDEALGQNINEFHSQEYLASDR
jgi:hypothetical protein